jgi:hypothetical protein
MNHDSFAKLRISLCEADLLQYDRKETKSLDFYFRELVWSDAFLGVAHRIMALVIYYRVVFTPIYQPQSIWDGVNSLLETRMHLLSRGLLSDLCFGVIISVLLSFLPRSLRITLFAVIIVLMSANTIHIAYNFSHIELSTAQAALSPVFLAAYSVEALVFLFPLAFFSFLGFLLSRGRPIVFSAFVIVLIAPFALIAGRAVSFDTNPSWLANHLFLPNLSLASKASVDGRSIVSEGAFATDKQLIVAPKYNVLLIFMEGVSAHSLDRGEMNFLKQIAAENLSFSRYLGNQIITINGLYAALTGRLPAFLTAQLKWFAVDVGSDVAKNSLPYRLRDSGYHTAFLQSAPLAYMGKDLIIPRLGFDVALGLEAWSEFYARNAWGVDDKTLFENISAYIADIPRERKWFVSALTSGTHSPYNVPEIFDPALPDERKRALRYLDSSLEELFGRLQAQGHLSDSVIVITSDESRELTFKGGVLDELALNWLPLIIVHPDQHNEVIDAYVSAHRLPEIVLGLASGVDPTDVVSKLGVDGQILAGNIVERRLFYIDTHSGTITACETGKFLCSVFEGNPDPLVQPSMLPSGIATFPRFKQEVLELDASP